MILRARQSRCSKSLPGPLLPLEPKIRDPKAGSVVTYDALDILREALAGLGVDIEGQRHPCATDTIQLAQDRLGDVADLRRRTIGGRA
jgi:hypothetical protein